MHSVSEFKPLWNSVDWWILRWSELQCHTCWHTMFPRSFLRILKVKATALCMSLLSRGLTWTVIQWELYPIPSALGSQISSGLVSSTVGDHVRSPGTVRFVLFLLCLHCVLFTKKVYFVSASMHCLLFFSPEKMTERRHQRATRTTDLGGNEFSAFIALS
jgi:hypothetical protein